MYDLDSNKDYCKDDYAKERKYKKEETCVEINIFCEDCKKEAKDDGYKNDCRKDYKDEKTCVVINIFCDDNKKDKDDYYKVDYKKDYKDGKTCVVVNIFCEDDKKKG